jgi:hypothetical protein
MRDTAASHRPISPLVGHSITKACFEKQLKLFATAVDD